VDIYDLEKVQGELFPTTEVMIRERSTAADDNASDV